MVDDLRSAQVAEFLDEHLQQLRSITPLESTHALDLDELRRPEITFWTVWDETSLVGCGAIKRLDSDHAELKSMRTKPSRLRTGVASALLSHILQQARRMGFRQISLETGSADYFLPARNLYQKYGFRPCEPFADYTLDPHSVYLTRQL